MQIEDALRRADPPRSSPVPSLPASAPSQAPFFRGPKPDPMARQKGLIEALRKRGS
jgi:hypothetical protein